MNTNITPKEAAEWGTAMLVFVSGASAGHYAAMGMTTVQWAGAAAAIIASVTAAVAVRIWPARVADAPAEQD